jgi:hypothetical protein
MLLHVFSAAFFSFAANILFSFLRKYFNLRSNHEYSSISSIDSWAVEAMEGILGKPDTRCNGGAR